jgi:outer membrane protein
MKKLIMILFGAGLLSISMTSFSQTVLKIGHVDIAEIMAALPQRDSAAAVLEKETKEYQSTFEEMTTVYNKMLDDYEKGQSTYSALVKKNKESELMDKEKRLQEFQQNATTALQKRNADLIQPIFDKIIKAISKVATDNGFTYILDVSKGAVVFTSKDSQNIDQLVLKVLKPM